METPIAWQILLRGVLARVLYKQRCIFLRELKERKSSCSSNWQHKCNHTVFKALFQHV